ncbi:MAG: universal stress protein [Formivibrio sp.]|nr:universal stress protein [Formivibrio sp.]
MYQHILVPVDSTSTGQTILKEAARLSKQCPHSIVRLVHVINMAEATMEALVYGSIQSEMKRADQVRAIGKKVIDDAFAAAKEAGLEPETRLVEVWDKAASEAILEEVKKWGADIIVMGTHGYRGVQHLLMGSVAEGVVRHTTIPVLLVRSHH